MGKVRVFDFWDLVLVYYILYLEDGVYGIYVLR